MIAYKGFNKDLACTLGHGTYQYKVGETYTEQKAECVRTGFHCVEEPIEVLSWYSRTDSRYCMVDALGDVHEDGSNKIACTTMKILKELSIEQIGALECEWIRMHPDRACSKHVKREIGEVYDSKIVVVRGKNPKAAGHIGSTIFLLKEGKGTKDIVEMGAYEIDGKTYKSDVYYRVDGREAKCRRKN